MTSRGIPFEELERILERLDDARDGGSEFAVDVKDADGRFTVTADLPGFESEDIEVEVQDRTLRIDAERSEDTKIDEEQYIRRERSERSTSRSLTLPEAVDEDATSASFQHGVLTVELPKASASDDGTTVDIE
ncbi:Hsp20/alpha crystallin family protein [Halobacterium wangiae]|uniref:Hsp20/alpha crystallin family protein n=1 Tax=Halobacterium wangiae TaxID=2902623 RepID=UPI001E2FE61A|nr:Hsp20/alpha crystallin family protein [Halobacterium wangiae]